LAFRTGFCYMKWAFFCRSYVWPRAVCFVANKMRRPAGADSNHWQHSVFSCN